MTDDDTLAGPRQLKEKGSPAWCTQTVSYLKDCMRHVSEDWRQAEQVLDELIEHQAWKLIPPGAPYRTMNRMLREEIGLDERAIKEQIRKAKLVAHGGDRRSADFQVDNINLKGVPAGGGTSEPYTTRRLRRDRPDLAARVEQGELSANAAAIEAGFRPKTFTIPTGDPVRAARRIGSYYTDPDQRKRLIEALEGL